MNCPFCIKTGDRTEYATEAELAAHRHEAHPEHEPAPNPESLMGAGLRAAPADPDPPYRGGLSPEQLYGYHGPPDVQAGLEQLAIATNNETAQQHAVNDHFTSELVAVRESLERIAGDVAQEAAGAGRAIADLERKLVPDIAVLEARIGAQEQQTFGERIRRLEELAGIVPRRPEEIEAAEGAPHRPPVSSDPSDGVK